ncbi:MAG: hypothetical protein ACNA7E_03170 [Wenzhouxiangellaceae bacterium]
MRIIFSLLFISLLAVGCGSSKQDLTRTETLQRYEAVMRWAQFHVLVDFMHPDWLAENPVSSLDVERLNQFQVSQYRVLQVVSLIDEDGFDRVVRLRLVSRHTARERVVDYIESWRWDSELERWLLHSGLPDVTSRI